MIDVESLLAEATESPPCGPDLEYDAAYIALDQLARGKAEQQIGTKVIPAETPRWAEVQAQTMALLLRSKDLRVATLLVRALVHTRGFVGLLPGLDVLHGLVDRYWDGVHPRLDADDGNDPTMRMNALAALADPLVLVRELRDAPLARSRTHGVVLVRDVEVVLGRLPQRAGSPTPSQAQIETVLAAVEKEDAKAFPRAAATLAAARALATLLNDRVSSTRAPDLKPLLATLQSVAQMVREPAPPPEAEAAVPEGEAVVAPGGKGEGSVAPIGTIRSRQDALQMLDRIIEYLERNEPTNPAPLLLKRGKRFMSMSFVDIVKEIAPDSIAKIDVIAGPRQDP